MKTFLSILAYSVLLAPLGVADFACKKDTPSQPCTDSPPETTSHSFVWQIDTVGGASSSSWNDVAIINDSLAYAVGEVYLRDTLGNVDPQPYNLGKWDGKNWSVQKIPYYYQGQPFYGPIYSVLAFSANDIWFGIGNMIHWDGQRFNPVELPSGVWGPYGINKIWGIGHEFYIVGDQGHIALFDGSSWQKVTSPTSINLLDIWGSIDPVTGNRIIFAIGSERQGGSAFCLLKIDGLNATFFDTKGLRYPGETSVWFSPGGPYYVIGNGVFMKKQLTDTLWTEIDNPSWPYVENIRGGRCNDVFIAGDFGIMLHYNGSTWKNYQDDGTLPMISNGVWISVAIKGNMVMAVGLIGGKAAMIRGVRR